MELREGPYLPSLCIYFLIASFLLYLGVGVGSLLPAAPDESLLERVFPQLFSTLPALFLTFRIAWILRRSESPQSKGRGLLVTIPPSLGIVVVGSILISIAIFREHWVELF